MKITSSFGRAKASDWRNPFAVALVVYYFAMALVGMLVPDDILKSHPWAREFSDFMSSIIPQIDRITALNIKPDVNRFYFSVLWAGSPAMAVLSGALIWSSRFSKHAKMWSLPLSKSLVWGLFLLAVIVGALNIYWVSEPTNRQLQFLVKSTAGRSFWGSAVYVHSVAMFGAMLAVWVYGWLSGYIPRNIEMQRNLHG